LVETSQTDLVMVVHHFIVETLFISGKTQTSLSRHKVSDIQHQLHCI